MAKDSADGDVKAIISTTRYECGSKAVAAFPMTLASPDYVPQRIYTRIITFYPVADCTDDAFDKIAQALKGGFQSAIDEFPYLSGTLTELEGGTCIIDAPVEGKGGAYLIIQRAPSVSIAALKERNFPNKAIPVCLSTEGWAVPPNGALLNCHVTQLADGVAVSCTMHHFLADGPGTFNFFAAWADYSRVGKLVNALAPVLDRTVLKARAGADAAAQVPFMIAKPDPEPPKNATPAPAAAPLKICTEYLHFSPRALERLKQTAVSTLGAGVQISTNDALTVLLWRAYTRARALDEAKTSRCSYACDCRNRIAPPLPAGYFGNVNIIATTALSAGEIVTKTLGDVAVAVRGATNRVDDSYIQSALKFLEDAPDKQKIRLTAQYFFGSDIVLSNWSKFAMSNLDFGFGKPVALRVPAATIDGFCLCLESALDGGVDVLSGLRQDHWDRLLADAELFEFADPLA